MTLPIYQIDAFARQRFSGNPAAVVPLESWLPDEMMQAIAMENNLAETAYVVRREDGTYDLRWFTPELEIPLCGHATLAAAFVLFTYYGFTGNTICFHTQSGKLFVNKAGDNRLVLDFPARPLIRLSAPEEHALSLQLTTILGKTPLEIFHSVNNYLAIYQCEEDVRSINPNISALNELADVIGVIVTAQGSGEYDCVSRYFCPNTTIPEDPVTGSAHCSLVPYWAEKLSKTTLFAYQASARGGEISCELITEATTQNQRVRMGGYAAPYLQGTIEV
ncbi:MAG: PhzF family phenazine biosynthesis protein [Ignavibacteria bacterium]|nr:PhzF family phenazine biosynthesis protein [Ignavibacteria bacterium]